MKRSQVINIATKWEDEKGYVLVYPGHKNTICIDVSSTSVEDGVLIHKELTPEVARDIANELLRLADEEPDDD